MHYVALVREPAAKDCCENLGVDGMIILKYIFKK
jgi:hypothetical protein